MFKKFLFYCLPRHWGLKGQSKELAIIDYFYDGVEADKKRAEILSLTEYDYKCTVLDIERKYNNITEYELESGKLKLKYQYDKITDKEYNEQELKLKLEHEIISKKEYDEKCVELIEDEKEKTLKGLECAFNYGEITADEYGKECATVNGEPWFNIDASYDEGSHQIVITFDYNQYFVEMLKSEGHPGNNDNELIDNFVRDWGRKLATDEMDESYDAKLARMNPTGGISNGEGLVTYE